MTPREIIDQRNRMIYGDDMRGGEAGAVQRQPAEGGDWPWPPGPFNPEGRRPELTTDAELLREAFERQACDSFGFKRSRKGIYRNPAVARDWKWFLAGVAYGARATQGAAPATGETNE